MVDQNSFADVSHAESIYLSLKFSGNRDELSRFLVRHALENASPEFLITFIRNGLIRNIPLKNWLVLELL